MDLVSCEDEGVNKKGEGLNQFDPPSILDDYSNEEILGIKDCGDEKLFQFKELGEALVLCLFVRKEKLARKEEFRVSSYILGHTHALVKKNKLR